MTTPNLTPHFSRAEIQEARLRMALHAVNQERLRATGLLVGAVRAAGGTLRVPRNGGKPIPGDFKVTLDAETDEYIVTLALPHADYAQEVPEDVRKRHEAHIGEGRPSEYHCIGAHFDPRRNCSICREAEDGPRVILPGPEAS